MPITPKEMVKLLKENGYYEYGQKGSHLKMKKDDVTIIVPLHNKDLKKGLEQAILKQAGIKK